MRKICVVTGTRAEYGLLSRLIRMIDDSDSTELQLIATNMHLSPKYGETYKEIEADGFHIDVKIPIINESDDDNAVSTLASMSRAIVGFSQAFKQLAPDIVVILGDRYEMLAVATCAIIERIPIAHIGGGDVTEGAYDDAVRNSISKMSLLHFTSTDDCTRRVIQMGETPNRVFNVGGIGNENIMKLPLMSKTEIEQSINFKVLPPTILVTYHPVTLGNTSVEQDINNFIKALEERKDLRIIITMPNSDTGGSVIISAIEEFVRNNSERCVAFKSLGVRRYLSLIQYVDAVVGNSSSGVVEVPSFGIPTLNIGDRQKGRLAAESVVNCNTDTESILYGLSKVLSPEFKELARTVQNPYEKPNTAENIFKIISTYPLDNIQKHFYDL